MSWQRRDWKRVSVGKKQKEHVGWQQTKGVVAVSWPWQWCTLALIHILSVLSLPHRGKVSQQPVLWAHCQNPPPRAAAQHCLLLFIRWNAGAPGDWGLWGYLCEALGGLGSGGDAGRAVAPGVCIRIPSHCFKWVFAVLLPARAAGTLKKSIFKMFYLQHMVWHRVKPIHRGWCSNTCCLSVWDLQYKRSKEAIYSQK